MFGKLFGVAKQVLGDLAPTQTPQQPRTEIDSPRTNRLPKNLVTQEDLWNEYKEVRHLVSNMPAIAVMDAQIKGAFSPNSGYVGMSFRSPNSELENIETRGQLFDLVVVLADNKVWTAEDVENAHSFEYKASLLALLCMNLLAHLINESFDLSPKRAKDVLRVMASNLPKMHLKAWARGYQIFKLGIIREIHKAVSSGLELTSDGKEAAARLLALLAEKPKDKGVIPEVKDNAVVKALREIAGLGQQATYFERARRAGGHREHDSGIKEFTLEHRQFWWDVIEQGKAIIQDYGDYKEGKPAAQWITNSSAFEAALGDHWKHIEYQFGWWLKNPPKLQYNFDISRSLLGKRGTPKFPSYPYLTAQRFAEICARAEIEDAKNRFSADAQRIMDVEAFTFGDRDSTGELFNQFERLTGSSPGAAWQKSVKAIIDRVGTEAVIAGFERWIKHLDKIDAPTPCHSSQGYVRFAKQSIGSAGRISGPLPSRGTIQYNQAIFRCAYYGIASSNSGIFDTGDNYGASAYSSSTRFNPSLSENNETIACGVAHALSLLSPQKAMPLLSRMLDNLLVEEERRESRSKKAVSAICASLGEIGTPEALALLGKVRRHITDKGQLKQIDKALAKVGAKESLSLDDMKDRAMASHGVDQNGRRVVEIEGWRAELWVESTRKAKLQTTSPSGKITRGIAKAFTELPGGAEAAKSLADSAKDIESILPEARKRLEGSYRNKRSWPLAFWQQHLVGNGLLNTIVSRLIWQFTDGKGKTTVAMLRSGALHDHSGKEINLKDNDWTVRLWHPVNDTAENVDAWRKFIIRENIRQPFLQAWRPVYIITDAERHTSTYSNRFAAHVLEQAPAMAVLKAKGWNAVNRVAGGNKQGNERVRITLPAYNLAAEYWVAGIGNRMQAIPGQDDAQSTMYAFVGTDRLAFFKLEEKNSVGGEVITIENVPTLALSEVMLDIDNIVARTSIGNDRNWKDEGANAQHPVSETINLSNYVNLYRAGRSAELAATRNAFLNEILPGLEIANCCTLQKDHLLVDGKYHSYKINLTSSGIHIAPNDQYLCIVPKAGSTRETLLPFEDDTVLSIIISKAMMLADEDQITDESIRRQLGLQIAKNT